MSALKPVLVEMTIIDASIVSAKMNKNLPTHSAAIVEEHAALLKLLRRAGQACFGDIGPSWSKDARELLARINAREQQETQQ